MRANEGGEEKAHPPPPSGVSHGSLRCTFPPSLLPFSSLPPSRRPLRKNPAGERGAWSRGRTFSSLRSFAASPLRPFPLPSPPSPPRQRAVTPALSRGDPSSLPFLSLLRSLSFSVAPSLTSVSSSSSPISRHFVIAFRLAIPRADEMMLPSTPAPLPLPRFPSHVFSFSRHRPPLLRFIVSLCIVRRLRDSCILVVCPFATNVRFPLISALLDFRCSPLR